MKISLAKKFITILICMVAVALTCQACNFPGTNAVAASETATPMPTASNPPTATATPQSTPAPTTIPVTASPSQTATITNLATPSTPPATNAFLYDSNSSL
ncbi:MAG TPA: hypothetical protein VKF38_03405, partial [Anaerolineaceae bacterium]|nr:hypothetical protein [Anaerolineaceae bacterium]